MALIPTGVFADGSLDSEVGYVLLIFHLNLSAKTEWLGVDVIRKLCSCCLLKGGVPHMSEFYFSGLVRCSVTLTSVPETRR